MKTTEDFMKI